MKMYDDSSRLFVSSLVGSCTRGAFIVYECVSQPAISLEQSCGRDVCVYVFVCVMHMCFPTSDQP